jgi:hypothetical protein
VIVDTILEEMTGPWAAVVRGEAHIAFEDFTLSASGCAGEKVDAVWL